jgi:hypothetical protein
MSQAVQEISPLAIAAERRKNVTALTQHVYELIEGLYPHVAAERRRYDRSPVPYLFRLTPLDADGQPLAGQPMTVVGRDISPRGMSFFHEQPLLFRRAIVTLDHPEVPTFTVEVDIRWCRFAKVGWYESGARLIRYVDAAVA